MAVLDLRALFSGPRSGALRELRGGMTKYRTIVVDPPWDHSDGTGFTYGRNHIAGNRKGEPGVTRPPYEHMSAADIALLPVDALAEDDAHLYLWTTQRYLHASFHIVEQWGFKVSATLVWCKAPQGFMGGAFRSSTEFIQFARRGSLPHNRQAPTRWFTWSRVGWTQTNPAAKHSRKPEHFYDLVEQVSPSPYVELFARRHRMGWDVWGDQSANTATLEPSA